MIPRNELCKHYRPWVVTNKGEINCACVDEEKRTITKCDYTESKGCWMSPKTTKSRKEAHNERQ